MPNYRLTRIRTARFRSLGAGLLIAISISILPLWTDISWAKPASQTAAKDALPQRIVLPVGLVRQAFVPPQDDLDLLRALIETSYNPAGLKSYVHFEIDLRDLDVGTSEAKAKVAASQETRWNFLVHSLSPELTKKQAAGIAHTEDFPHRRSDDEIDPDEPVPLPDGRVASAELESTLFGGYYPVDDEERVAAFTTFIAPEVAAELATTWQQLREQETQDELLDRAAVDLAQIASLADMLGDDRVSRAADSENIEDTARLVSTDAREAMLVDAVVASLEEPLAGKLTVARAQLIAHELGHLLGLIHIDSEPLTLMSTVKGVQDYEPIGDLHPIDQESLWHRVEAGSLIEGGSLPSLIDSGDDIPAPPPVVPRIDPIDELEPPVDVTDPLFK